MEIFTTYVVYNLSYEQPYRFVVKKWDTWDGGNGADPEVVYDGDNLLTARSKILDIEPRSVCCVASKMDERRIMEVWI